MSRRMVAAEHCRGDALARMIGGVMLAACVAHCGTHAATPGPAGPEEAGPSSEADGARDGTEEGSRARSGDGSPGHPEATPVTAECSAAIDTVDAPPDGYRTVLDVIAVPERMPHVSRRSPQGDPSARYFAKAGLLVLSGHAPTLSVPAGWRQRLSIEWAAPRGNALRLPSCGEASGDAVWHVYPGGLWAGEPACVPLEVRLGDRRARVTIGVGTRCAD